MHSSGSHSFLQRMLMMGCPLGHTSSYSEQNDVIAEDLYNHLEAHLNAANAELSTGK